MGGERESTAEKIVDHVKFPFSPSPPSPYSVRIAANGLSFIARLAGKYPASIPIRVENAIAVSASHQGMADSCMPAT